MALHGRVGRGVVTFAILTLLTACDRAPPSAVMGSDRHTQQTAGGGRFADSPKRYGVGLTGAVASTGTRQPRRPHGPGCGGGLGRGFRRIAHLFGTRFR